MAFPINTSVFLREGPVVVIRSAELHGEHDEWCNSPFKCPPLPEDVFEMITLAGVGLMYDPTANEWVMVMPKCKGTYRFQHDFRRNYRQWVRKVERALEEDERQMNMRLPHNGNVIIWDQQEWR